MAIEKLRTNNLQLKPEIELKPKIKLDTKRADSAGSANSLLGEAAFRAAFTKEAVNRLFADVTDTAVVTTDAKPPVDYFDIDKKADEIIKNNTDEGFFGSSLDTDAVGTELAEIAKNNPQEARALTDNILDKIAGRNRDEVARSLTDSLSAKELRNVAEDADGREMLGQLKGHLLSGSVHGDERATAARIDTAIKAADLENNAEFQKLDATVREQIFSQIESNETNAAAVDNIINLAASGEFLSLPVNTQKAMLTALSNHAEDAIFVEGLKVNAGKADFIALDETGQAQVIDNLDRFAQTESYNGSSGFLGIFGKNSISEADKAFLLDKLGDTAIYSVANPGVASVKNTLEKIVSGEIKIDTYSEAADSKTGEITLGYNNGNGTLNMNTHPDAGNPAFGKNAFTDTLVHELNHQLNQGAPHGTPDQFLNEYRAFYTGLEAVGTTMDGTRLDGIVRNLLGSYEKIDDLYKSDADFKKFIDDVRTGFGETPPRLLDPEQMRQALLDAGFSSDYLNTPANIDNH